MNKSKRKMEECFCHHCGNPFQKPISEIKRNKEKHRPNFCSRSCVGMNNIKNFGDKSWNFKDHPYTRAGDEYTKFRYHYRNILKRNYVVEVTIDDLKEQWEKQLGVCEFTGVELMLSTYSKIEKNPIYTASLDRIDSSKGYVKGNIRWISRAINWMKNEMSDDMVWSLCHIISKNITKKGVMKIITP
jgi:hypothetical protein